MDDIDLENVKWVHSREEWRAAIRAMNQEALAKQSGESVPPSPVNASTPPSAPTNSGKGRRSEESYGNNNR